MSRTSLPRRVLARTVVGMPTATPIIITVVILIMPMTGMLALITNGLRRAFKA